MAEKKAYAKPRVKCGFCGQELTVNGLTAHIRFKHPDKLEDFKKNREAYLEKWTITEDAPEPDVPEEIEEEEPAVVSVEADADDSFPEEEPEPEPKEFKIRKIKKSESKPKPKRKTEPKKEPEKERFVYNPYFL